MSQLAQPIRSRESSKPDCSLENSPLRILAGLSLLIAVVFLIYWPAIHGGFLLDDDLLLTDNALVKAPNGLYRIWLTREPVDYWPVTNTSFWLQWRLWQMSPTGYHVVNLLLHLANCSLIWLLLKRLAIPGAFLAALLFAAHPVNVQSIAWIAQQKTLLAVFFFLISILWFLKAHGSTNRWVWLSLLAFVLAMLSKGSVAILPLVLLLIVWWQTGQITRRDTLQLAPFFAVAIVLTIVNVWFQTHGSETAIRTATFAQRLAGAGAVIWFYLSKALLPTDLSFVYPQWHIDAASPLWWLPLAAALIVTLLLWKRSHAPSRNWPRNLLFAWLLFCVALLPVLGFVDVGYMRHSLVADHYQYIALISVVALIAAAGSYWHSKLPAPAKTYLTMCAAAVVAVLGLLTWQQSHLYANSITLYEAALQKNPTSWLIQTNLSLDQAEIDRIDDALRHAQEALRLNPDYAQAHNALGLAQTKHGELEAAIQQYQLALALNPNLAEAHSNLGAVLASQGQTASAMDHLQHAIQLKPDLFQAHWYLAQTLAGQGQLEESLNQLQIAAQLHPGFVEAEINMARILNSLGHPQESLAHYENARQLNPNLPEAYSGLATVNAELNRPTEAIAAAKTGLDLARSTGQTQLAEELDAWLTDYGKQQAAPARNNH
ncbi:MAG TPA: tetratricopeptide repeat protein [Pirellulales bacterium]|jgi:tetratricopeptide (TPR) repeat protein